MIRMFCEMKKSRIAWAIETSAISDQSAILFHQNRVSIRKSCEMIRSCWEIRFRVYFAKKTSFVRRKTSFSLLRWAE